MLDHPEISIVINTLNEENNITDCIVSVIDMSDEIIVCDMYSDDQTSKIAEELGARIIFHERTGFVEPARHYAISQARNEWVLVIDADERMTEKLAEKLKILAKENQFDLVKFGILYEYFGDFVWHGGFFKTGFPRFFRLSEYLRTFDKEDLFVHQDLRSINRFARRQLELPSDYHILHLAYPTIEKYINKTIGMYARIEGQQYYQQGRKFSIWRLVSEPIKEILNRFIRLGGFREGMRGLILIVLYAVYRFAVWANVWYLEELQRKKETRLPNIDEL